MRVKKNFLLLLITLILSACAVGPNYVRPNIQVPAKYKEAPKGFKIAKPQDACNRGAWWTVFHDPELNALEAVLNTSNQNVAVADANYRQARALVDQARASYFPTLTGTASITRQQQSLQNSSSSNSVSSGGGASTTPFNTESLLLTASWEPDLWGTVRRTVESNTAGAQASEALLALTRLSAQASLAQFYFELRGADKDQTILNDTVNEYKKALQLTLNRYHAGIVSRSDVIQAQSQLEATQSDAINNGIVRAQYEHAIAVLIGQPASTFSLKKKNTLVKPPQIPTQIPSELLERRPDVAQAERQMAQANAQIGVAIAAYFPTLTIAATGDALGTGGVGRWISAPALGWSLGPTLAETILDGGLRSATIKAARAGYESSVANYRQVVLAAFQDVEDNLASLRILNAESIVRHKATVSAKLSLKLIVNQYKAGTLQYSDVIIAQYTAYAAEKNEADVNYLRMTSAVGLIKALGGGWNVSTLS